jgi:outer membrane protein assembly factor BamB
MGTLATELQNLAMNSRLIPCVALAFTLAALPTSVFANWLHYRGPSQNGTVPEKLPASLGEPKQLWKVNVGTGTCAVTASGGRAFTAGNYDKKNDVLVCLDAATGKGVWRFEYPQALDPNLFEGGPRATPTLDGGNVYMQAQQGELFCLDADSGKVKWQKHIKNEFDGKKPEWGYSGSPTIEGHLVIVEPGGPGASTVALNKTSGEVVWKSGSDLAGYASPVVATIGGKRTVILFKARTLVGLDLKNGQELWRTEWKTDYDINAATPLVFGNSIFISSGYGTGAAVFEVSGGNLNQKWRNKSLRAHINTPVIHQGHVFGIDGNTGGGNLVCLDLATGDKKWEEKSVKGGSLVLSGDKLVVLTEKGELVIADATAGGCKANLRSQVLDKRCWVQPTISGGKLLVKNNAGDLACFELK